MPNRKMLAALVFLFCTDVFGQEETKTQAFNESWQAYLSAGQSGDTELLIQTARDVLTVGQGLLDPADERLPVLMLNYGIALNDGRRTGEAQETLANAAQLAEEVHGEDAIELVQFLAGLADSYSQSDDKKTRRHYRQALQILGNESSKESDAYATLAVRAGAALYGSRYSSAGERYVQEARDYYLKSKGEESVDAGIAAFYLGKFAYSRQKFKSSTEHLLSALTGLQSGAQGALKYQLLARALLVNTLERRGKSDEATEHCVAIGRLSASRDIQNHEPLFRLAPKYPREMFVRNAEGYVDLSFTVNEHGFVRDVRVINTGREGEGFEDAAIAAAEGFRYAPRFENGEAVAADDIKTRISFELR